MIIIMTMSKSKQIRSEVGELDSSLSWSAGWLWWSQWSCRSWRSWWWWSDQRFAESDRSSPSQLWSWSIMVVMITTIMKMIMIRAKQSRSEVCWVGQQQPGGEPRHLHSPIRIELHYYHYHHYIILKVLGPLQGPTSSWVIFLLVIVVVIMVNIIYLSIILDEWHSTQNVFDIICIGYIVKDSFGFLDVLTSDGETKFLVYLTHKSKGHKCMKLLHALPACELSY